MVQNICVPLQIFVGADVQSARREPTNSPQISVKTVHTARADVGIGPYNMLCMDISWLGIPEMSRTEIDAVCP